MAMTNSSKEGWHAADAFGLGDEIGAVRRCAAGRRFGSACAATRSKPEAA
jgi:hypothetical protein